jgi:hypothetical protein
MILTMSSISWKLAVEVEVRRKGELAANLVEKRMISCPLQAASDWRAKEREASEKARGSKVRQRSGECEAGRHTVERGDEAGRRSLSLESCDKDAVPPSSAGGKTDYSEEILDSHKDDGRLRVLPGERKQIRGNEVWSGERLAQE